MPPIPLREFLYARCARSTAQAVLKVALCSSEDKKPMRPARLDPALECRPVTVTGRFLYDKQMLLGTRQRDAAMNRAIPSRLLGVFGCVVMQGRVTRRRATVA